MPDCNGNCLQGRRCDCGAQRPMQAVIAVGLLLVLVLLLLSGCSTYQWRENQRVDVATVHKIETPLAGEFCSKLLDSPKRACAIRLTDTGNNSTRCVMVIAPGDGEATAHEGGHCMGYDH